MTRVILITGTRGLRKQPSLQGLPIEPVAVTLVSRGREIDREG